MELDDIKPNEPVLMTAGLQRLFKAAGCSPTSCHACRSNIEPGMHFKLVPHGSPPRMTKCAACRAVRRNCWRGIKGPLPIIAELAEICVTR